MEARDITIVLTSNQSKYVVNTDATTLGELKAALREQQIPYEGMTFYEGLSHSELLTDESILPHDIRYKDEITNNLVFMLTTPNKKIRSGADEVRKALYDSIKELNLQQAVVDRYGHNFTQCKNSELLEIIEENTPAHDAVCPNVVEAVDVLVGFLEEGATITPTQAKTVRNILKGEKESAPYSDKEIDEMFTFLNNR